MSCADWTTSWAFNVNLSKRTILSLPHIRKTEGPFYQPAPRGITTSRRAARKHLLSVTRAGDGHFYLARFGFFALRQRDGQYAVLVFGGDRFRVQCVGQREAAAERAVGALDAQEVLLGYGLFKLTLSAYREQVVLDPYV